MSFILKRLLLSWLIAFITSPWALGSPPDDKVTPPLIQAVRSNEIVSVDGRLLESIWKRPGFTKFIQKDPVENGEPTEQTEVWVAYDDDAVYVAARMYDSAPDSMVIRLSRRDANWDSDMFFFYVDPYHDRRSGFYFALDAAGTLYDGVLYNDEWNDGSWDGIWEGKVRTDSKGWTAEMRIPFSQLRFHKKEAYVWGVNFRREIARKNERNFVVFTPKDASGFVSRFVDLVGIQDISPVRQIELLPYVTTRAEFMNSAKGDPFNNGAKYTPRVGADLKIGVGSNLTLDGTVNPDFGQVEVDPAVVNLSDVETFFQEKRPFFIEGANTFTFGRGGATNNWSFNWPNPTIFYSRRIGRAPSGGTPAADFKDVPTGTTILGAAKLSGKVGDNWNLGVIQAVTDREHARLSTNGARSRAEVEPLSYYGVTRIQKEFNAGNQGLGILSTIAARNFDDDRLRNRINSASYVLGVDGWTFLDSSRTFVMNGWTGISHVRGNEARMISLQRSSARYFQRPDAAHVSVDSLATSLTGIAGRFYANKQRGNMVFNASLGFISPEFETNDLGFQSRADVINTHVSVGHKWTEVTSFYRWLEFGGSLFRSYDFDGNIIWQGIFQYGFIRFLNFYQMEWSFAYNPETVSNRRTRGGPLTLNPPGYEFSLWFSSDRNRTVVVQLSGNTYQSAWSRNWNIFTELSWRPSSNVSFSLSPRFENNVSHSQWVGVFADPHATATFGSRYVFGQMNQKTLSASIRLNWTFTPQLSLQLFLQPLISAGDYVTFKELARPRSYDFITYGENGSTITRDGSTYTVDPDGSGPAAALSFRNPDFNIKSLRGNAVLRWEYLPGSTLFFVWTQSRFDFEDIGSFSFDRSVRRLWNAQPENIFMIKMTYWWNG